jgi:hypothetical protein
VRGAARRAVYFLLVPIGAGLMVPLADLYRRSPLGTRFAVWLAWLPVRGAFLALYRLHSALA